MINAKRDGMSGNRRIGDVTTITTDNSQLVVEIVADGAIIREPGTYRPLAKFNTRDKYEITKLVRRCSSFLKMKKNLETLGVELARDTMELLEAQYNSASGRLKSESLSKRDRQAYDKALLSKAREGGRPAKKHKAIPVLAKRKKRKKRKKGS